MKCINTNTEIKEDFSSDSEDENEPIIKKNHEYDENKIGLSETESDPEVESLAKQLEFNSSSLAISEDNIENLKSLKKFFKKNSKFNINKISESVYNDTAQSNNTTPNKNKLSQVASNSNNNFLNKKRKNE